MTERAKRVEGSISARNGMNTGRRHSRIESIPRIPSMLDTNVQPLRWGGGAVARGTKG
jgi:hypothetical protein